MAPRRRADLPFAEGEFDVVTCQSGLMFVPDVAKAVREMARVLAPGGTLAVQVWSRLESQPGYGPFVEVAARHAGPGGSQAAREGLLDPWRPRRAGRALRVSGLAVTATRTRLGTARFDSVDELVTTEVEGTPLAERISQATYRRMLGGRRRGPVGRSRSPGAGSSCPSGAT